MDAKPKVDWAENEVTSYAKHCIVQQVQIIRVIKN
ncbi:DUF3012 domain-containing protein [Vibrio fluvialis]|jgi:hypothetical protein|nr:DUF3012 domain-containing protein [Vibrio fluvialis]MCG6408263.1 DUF3012 domain-containing protein [Vibrio fluvialis]MCR9301153.1 DUF3012 domain-containing protein [Vibrio fluvialis]